VQSKLALTTIGHVLGLADVAIESYHFREDGALIIQGCSCWEIAVCPDCGTISQDPNGYGEPHLIRDLSIFGQPCYLELRGHRFACEECRDTFTERLNWVGHKRRYTRRYEEYIYSLCQKCDHTAVAELEGLTFDRVQGIFERQAQEQLVPWTERLFRCLNIDEISNKKRHGEYLLVVSSADLGGVLDVLPDRKKETLEKWFDQLSEEQKTHLEEVCIDMWEPYLLAVKAKLPAHVKVTIDRFHVVKNLHDAVSKTRRTIQREADDETKAVLKGCRWTVVKNRENLSEKERARLPELYAASPELQLCHDLKDEFRAIFDLRDRQEAESWLEDWIATVEASALKPLQRFVKTLRNWWKHILNYFHHRSSNGFAEGMNNKIKMLKRRGFGFLNFDHFRLRILVACGV
jgi:transposase